MSMHAPAFGRIRTGPLASDKSAGNNGAFSFSVMVTPTGGLEIISDQPMAEIVESLRKGVAGLTRVNVISSVGCGWEHVSVTVHGVDRCPTWPEMCAVKNIFWDKADTVLQYHPPEAEYVNNHEYCLHLWRPSGFNIETPPSFLVGTVKQGGEPWQREKHPKHQRPT